jgi:hypothetical protein
MIDNGRQLFIPSIIPFTVSRILNLVEDFTTTSANKKYLLFELLAKFVVDEKVTKGFRCFYGAILTFFVITE